MHTVSAALVYTIAFLHSFQAGQIGLAQAPFTYSCFREEQRRYQRACEFNVGVLVCRTVKYLYGSGLYSILASLREIVVRMGRRRGEVQILIDILGTSLKGVKITRLMYKSNLSYSTLRRYLLAMSKQGLIAKVCNVDGSVMYRSTEKGKLVLDRLKEVNCVLRV
jgi:predicted transcriptional regulator